MKNTKRTIAGLAIGAAVLAPGAALAVGGFSDVPDDHTHAAGIEWVAANGITSGCTPTTYCPSETVSRAQMATFLHRIAGFGADPSVNAALLEGLTAQEIIDAAVDSVESPPPPPPAAEAPRDPFAFVTGGSAFTHTGAPVPLPGASTNIVVPDGETAVLEVDFAAESACYGAAGYCTVRILVDGVEAAPATGNDFAFDSTDNNTETASSWESHGMSRLVAGVGPGNHTVTVDIQSGGPQFRLDDWSLTVDGHLV